MTGGAGKKRDEDVGMVDVSWPNEAAPGMASFRVDVPSGWTASEAPGVLMVLAGPGTDGFRPNVTVTGDRVPTTVSVGEVADGALTEHGDSLTLGDRHDRPAAGDELPVAVRRGTVLMEGVEVAQLVVATEAEDRSPSGLRSVFVVTGSFLAARLHDDEPVIKELIESFSVGNG